MAPHKKQSPKTHVLLEYYSRPFGLLNYHYSKSSDAQQRHHPIRERFWKHLSIGVYGQRKAIEILQSYLKSLEDAIRREFMKHSIAYWLHAYRRLSPGPISVDERPTTIGLTRAVFEAGMQKYGMSDLCDGIGESKKLEIQAVLGGILLSDDFEPERTALVNGPNQLVLSNFTTVELGQLYNVERLAYEVFRTGATLRIVGKGAHLAVVGAPDWFTDDRNDELAFLIANYDERDHSPQSTSLGVSYEGRMATQGAIFVPTYNLGGVDMRSLGSLTKRLYRIQLPADLRLNFIWTPFDMRRYRDTHLPISDAFLNRHGVSLDVALSTISALCIWATRRWMLDGIEDFLHLWKRAYLGPFSFDKVSEAVQRFWGEAHEVLCNADLPGTPDVIDRGIRFWTLGEKQRAFIDTVYSGPHQVILPAGSDRFFVDFAWLHRRMYDLFVGVSIPDQNFKGKALEDSVAQKASILPNGECVAADGSRKQIDFAASSGKLLLIVECKAVARSIAYDRGRPEAIDYRRKSVVIEGLRQADEKARWLCHRPHGRNYDISQFTEILAVVVSPFVEFVHSRENAFWVSASIPRVLTPGEFSILLSNPNLLRNCYNRLPVSRVTAMESVKVDTTNRLAPG